MLQHLWVHRVRLHDRPGRCQRTKQHRQSPGRRIGLRPGLDDLPVRLARGGEVLGDRLPVNAHLRRVEHRLDLLHHRLDTARLIQILHVRRPCRAQLGQVRGLGRHLPDVGHRQVNLGLLGDRQQVQHRVRRPAQRHVHRQRVAQRRLGHDLPRGHPALDQIHHRPSRLLGVTNSLTRHRRRRPRPRQRQPHCLRQTAHRVRREHT